MSEQSIQLSNLCAQGGSGTRPVQNDVGAANLPKQRHLAADAPQGLRAREAVPFLEAGDLRFLVGGHDDNLVDSLVDAGFEEQRYVVHDNRARVFSRCLSCQPRLLSGDTRMDNSLESS